MPSTSFTIQKVRRHDYLDPEETPHADHWSQQLRGHKQGKEISTWSFLETSLLEHVQLHAKRAIEHCQYHSMIKLNKRLARFVANLSHLTPRSTVSITGSEANQWSNNNGLGLFAVMTMFNVLFNTIFTCSRNDPSN